MVDTMLSLQESEPEYYTDEIIKGIILVRVLINFCFYFTFLLTTEVLLHFCRQSPKSYIGQTFKLIPLIILRAIHTYRLRLTDFR